MPDNDKSFLTASFFLAVVILAMMFALLLTSCDTITGTDGAEYIVDCNDPFNQCGAWEGGG